MASALLEEVAINPTIEQQSRQPTNCRTIIPKKSLRCYEVREIRGGFLLPDQKGPRSEAGSTPVCSPPPLSALVAAGIPGRLAPGSVRSGLAWDQVGAVGGAGRAGGAPPPVPSWLGRKGDVGCGEEALNLGRRAEGVEGQRVLTPKRT